MVIFYTTGLSYHTFLHITTRQSWVPKKNTGWGCEQYPPLAQINLYYWYKFFSLSPSRFKHHWRFWSHKHLATRLNCPWTLLLIQPFRKHLVIEPKVSLISAHKHIIGRFSQTLRFPSQ